MRLVQHKKEAYWFYRFLSIFYDHYVNPFFWTAAMRDASLELAALDDPALTVVDVGAGTGFTTQGIVAHLPATQVTCIDQSPHQLARARQKPELAGCTFHEGDAEELPFPTDHFDRYVSAGSIEYWPEPQRGIAEAYRVLKPGGVALMIGPLRPANPVARAAADAWMLFPEEDAYVRWFEAAGFTDLKKRYIRPRWVRKEAYGIALSGVKPQAGPSPVPLKPVKREDVRAPMTAGESVTVAARLIGGSLAGFLFIPFALLGYARQGVARLLGEPTVEGGRAEPLTRHQKAGLCFALAGLLLLLFRRRD